MNVKSNECAKYQETIALLSANAMSSNAKVSIGERGIKVCLRVCMCVCTERVENGMCVYVQRKNGQQIERKRKREKES